MLKELREKRTKAVAEARAIYAKAEAENRDMNAQENEQFDKFLEEERSLGEQIDAAEKSESRLSWLKDAEADLQRSAGRKTNPGEPGDEQRGRGRGDDEDRSRKPIEIECRGLKFRAEPGSPVWNRHQDEALEQYRRYLVTGEKRDLQMDLSTAGGFLVTPERIGTEILKDVDNASPIREIIRKFTVMDAASLGVATITDRISSRRRGSELGAPTADTSLKFGKRSLTPSPTVGEILVSGDLLRVSSMNPEAIIRQEIAYEEAIGLEQEYMTGTGANEPLGLFTASADGIPTTRDISTGNADDAPTFDGLTRAKMALKLAYRNRAKWLFHRDVLTVIMLIKDGNGQYIWQPSKQEGEPDRLLGLPVVESEYAPNTLTTGLYAGLIGDFDWYWHVDQIGLEIKRLDELHARTNQVGFLYRAKNDAAPMRSEAFARVKLG